MSSQLSNSLGLAPTPRFGATNLTDRGHIGLFQYEFGIPSDVGRSQSDGDGFGDSDAENGEGDGESEAGYTPGAMECLSALEIFTVLST